MIKVLVLGAGGTAGHNFMQSLKLTGGYITYGCDTNKYHALASGADFCYHIPQDEYEKIDVINRIVAREKIDIIHAQPDREIDFIAKFRNEFGAKVFLPSDEALLKCSDKRVTNNILESFDIPVPKTITYSEYIESEFLENTKLWIRPKKGAGSKASLPIFSKREAMQWVLYWVGRGLLAEDFIVSEFLPGKEYAWQSLWNDGELITCQARIRLEYIFSHLTPSGQSSSPSVAKTISDAQLNKIGTDAVLAINAKPHGIFGIDCKEDNNGQIKITEINAGRFLSTTLFFAKAGLNIPDIFCKILVGQKFIRPKQYNPLENNLYWIRALDREPKIYHEKDFLTM